MILDLGIPVGITRQQLDELFVPLDIGQLTRNLEGFADWLFDQGVMFVQDNIEKDIDPTKVKAKAVDRLLSVLGITEGEQ